MRGICINIAPGQPSRLANLFVSSFNSFETYLVLMISKALPIVAIIALIKIWYSTTSCNKIWKIILDNSLKISFKFNLFAPTKPKIFLLPLIISNYLYPHKLVFFKNNKTFWQYRTKEPYNILAFRLRDQIPNPEVKLVSVDNSTAIAICGKYQTVSSLTVMVSKDKTRSLLYMAFYYFYFL